MSKIPFNMKYRPQIESGEYLLIDTLDRPIRIVEWPEQRKDGKIVYEATTAGGWLVKGLVGTDGKIANEDTGTVVHELIIVTPDIVGLTDFEKAVQEASFLEIHPSDEDAIKEQAKHLLALARKELEKEYDGKAMLHVADKSYEKGKKDALNEMPHWRTARTMEAVGPAVVLTRCDNNLCSAVLSGVVRYGDVYITLQELNKLPTLP